MIQEKAAVKAGQFGEQSGEKHVTMFAISLRLRAPRALTGRGPLMPLPPLLTNTLATVVEWHAAATDLDF